MICDDVNKKILLLLLLDKCGRLTWNTVIYSSADNLAEFVALRAAAISAAATASLAEDETKDLLVSIEPKNILSLTPHGGWQWFFSSVDG